MAVGIFIGFDKQLEEREFNELADYQAAVDGYIEAVGLFDDGTTMFVNEEYLLHMEAKHFNSIASDVAGLGGRPDLMLQQPILGNVVVVGGPDDEGETTDVTDKARRAIAKVAGEAGGTWTSV
jgi:hypothetical protein